MGPTSNDAYSQQQQQQQKPKRGSPMQFGSVFSPGSANSVSKLTNIFKSNKADKLARDSSLPPTPSSQVPPSGGGYPASSGGVAQQMTPAQGNAGRASPQGQGASEVDLWRPQSAEERQQCMDAYDMKVSN